MVAECQAARVTTVPYWPHQLNENVAGLDEEVLGGLQITLRQRLLALPDPCFGLCQLVVC